MTATFAAGVAAQLAAARQAQAQLSRLVDLLLAATDVATSVDQAVAELSATAESPPPTVRITTAEPASAGSPPAVVRTVTPDDLDQLACVCGKVCANRAGLAAHQRHCAEYLEVDPAAELTGGAWECNDCDGLRFESIRALLGHTRAMHGRKPTASEKMPVEVA